MSTQFLLCCFFFLPFFPRGKGYFNLLVGGMRGSSSADQIMTQVFISILEVYISFGGRCEVLGVSKESFFIIVYIPNIFLLIFCNFYMLFKFVLVHVSVFVCLFVRKCVVLQLSVSYHTLNVCLRSLQTTRGHSFVNFLFLAIREKD